MYVIPKTLAFAVAMALSAGVGHLEPIAERHPLRVPHAETSARALGR